MIGIEREYIHFIKRGDELVERRFKSSVQWPKACRFYALASDYESIERCKRQALKAAQERAAEKAAADARHERYRIKQVDIPVLHIDEPTPPIPPPVRRFAVPVKHRAPMLGPRR